MAQAVFAERGFRAPSMDEIALRAGRHQARPLRPFRLQGRPDRGLHPPRRWPAAPRRRRGGRRRLRRRADPRGGIRSLLRVRRVVRTGLVHAHRRELGGGPCRRGARVDPSPAGSLRRPEARRRVPRRAAATRSAPLPRPSSAPASGWRCGGVTAPTFPRRRATAALMTLVWGGLASLQAPAPAGPAGRGSAAAIAATLGG